MLSEQYHDGQAPPATAPGHAVSLNDRLAAHFRAHDGEWLNARDLFFAGSMGWRTRISNVRRQYGMTIENRVSRRVDSRTGKRFTCSEYRYISSPVQDHGETGA